MAVNCDGMMAYDICDNEATLDFIETEMTKKGEVIVMMMKMLMMMIIKMLIKLVNVN